MKILLVHSYYVLSGGEEAVLKQEINLLQHDADIELLSFSNKAGFKGALQFFFSIWNYDVAFKLKQKIINFKPDVIHIHNWHFASGPVIIRVAKQMNVPIVMTLHNYRIICPSGTFLMNGKIVKDSLHSNFPWTAVFNKAYRDSFLQSLWLALVVWFHKMIGTWKLVDKFITLTSFAKDLFLTSTLDFKDNQFTVKPNFVVDKGHNIYDRHDHLLFVGRLSHEKGINLLLSASIKAGLPIKIIGDGPMRDQVIKTANQYPFIEYLGSMPNDKIRNEMCRASALVFPSVWFEGMPMTMVEAFSTGTPIIAARLGAMQSMIEENYNGILFKASDVDDLTKHMKLWSSFPLSSKINFSKNSRNTYEKLYTPQANRDMLLNIYEVVLNSSMVKS